MRDREQFLFGINPVLEKLKASAGDIIEVAMTAPAGSSALRAVEAQARRLGLRVSYVGRDVLDRLADSKKHQGVVARVTTYAYARFSDLLQCLSSLSETDWFCLLLLDGLTDPQNVGALLRTAEAVGIRHIVIPKDRSVGVTPAVAKASSGAVSYLNVYRVTNLRRAIDALKEHGFWIVGLDKERGQPMYDRRYPGKLGIVLGSEGSGIRPLIRQACDYLVSIPMKGNVASLNVSVAGAVFLYEVLRQRENVDKNRSKG